MRKSVIFCALPLSMLSIASAEGFYLRGNIGKTFNNNETFTLKGAKYSLEQKNNTLYGIALGMQMSPNLAAELDLRSREGKLNNKTASQKSTLQTRSAMLNGVYQFDFGRIKPYAKAGIGMASHKLSGKSNNSLAWAAGTGVNVYLSKQVALNLDYQYLNGGDVKKASQKFDANNHEITLGVRVDF